MMTWLNILIEWYFELNLIKRKIGRSRILVTVGGMDIIVSIWSNFVFEVLLPARTCAWIIFIEYTKKQKEITIIFALPHRNKVYNKKEIKILTWLSVDCNWLLNEFYEIVFVSYETQIIQLIFIHIVRSVPPMKAYFFRFGQD